MSTFYEAVAVHAGGARPGVWVEDVIIVLGFDRAPVTGEARLQATRPQPADGPVVGVNRFLMLVKTLIGNERTGGLTWEIMWNEPDGSVTPTGVWTPDAPKWLDRLEPQIRRLLHEQEAVGRS